MKVWTAACMENAQICVINTFVFVMILASRDGIVRQVSRKLLHLYLMLGMAYMRHENHINIAHSFNLIGGVRGAVVVRLTTGQQVERSILH